MKTLRQLLLTEDWHSATQDPRINEATSLIVAVARDHECGPEDLNMLCDLIRGKAKTRVRDIERMTMIRSTDRDGSGYDDEDKGKF